MKIFPKITVTVITLFLIQGFLCADTVILNDGMVMEGEITEDVKGSHIKLKNYHGEFEVKYNMIKSIKKSSQSEKEINNSTETTKIPETKEEKKSPETKKEITDYSYKHILYIMPRIASTMGKLKDSIPVSYGLSLGTEIDGGKYLSRKTYCETGLLYSSKDEKKLWGINVSAGPIWNFPFNFLNKPFTLRIVPMAGIGYYGVKNGDREAAGLKWHGSILAGPVFNFQNILLLIQLRFNYIHDKTAPLYSAGFTIGAGVKF